MGKIVRRASLLSELPEDALAPLARVTMMGRGTVLVEGQCGVVELGNTCIRLRTPCGLLSISGRALELAELSCDAAMIRGSEIDSAGYA